MKQLRPITCCVWGTLEVAFIYTLLITAIVGKGSELHLIDNWDELN